MSESKTILHIGNLSVYSSKVEDRRNQALKVVSSGSSSTRYSFTGFSEEAKLQILGKERPENWETSDDGRISTVIPDFEGCIFFDQTPYHFSIHLPDAKTAYIDTLLASWEEASFWDPQTQRLTIPLNFGNDLGDFELRWGWIDGNDEQHTASMRSQVFSTKLDIRTHFEWMIHDIKQFDWLSLDLLRQTTWGWSRDDAAESNQKTWLLIFQEVRTGMDAGFRRLIDQHRHRLVSELHMQRAERIRKMGPRLEERIAEGMLDNPDRRYRVEKQRLSHDTPENRYMKHILLHTLATLHELVDRLEPVKRMSDVFKDRLKAWATDWEQLRQNSFWQGIGAYQGLSRESLILSQDPLYAGIRRSWYWLAQGMVFLENDLRGGIQNIAQLYEIWCLVQIDRILLELGWKPLGVRGEEFGSDEEDWKEDEEARGIARKFSYTKEDRRIDLLYQASASQTASKNSIWADIRSYPERQIPDIVLRLFDSPELGSQHIYTWIFDAKYRVDETRKAPSDAINQMHQYRDAILWHSNRYIENPLFREGIGAFVLYPGVDPKDTSQQKSIDSVNIGAISVIPEENAEAKTDAAWRTNVPEALAGKIKALIELVDDDGYTVREGCEAAYKPVPKLKHDYAG